MPEESIKMTTEISMENVGFIEAGEDSQKQKKDERITWSKPVEFILNVIGYNVGLGNVWRFPYLCYKNGGGAFLIPYILMLCICGLPVLFQELAMGQFTKQGAIGAWQLIPMMRGIGFAGLLLAIYYVTHIIVVMAWCLFYLVHSFTSEALPWSTCTNHWNTNSCIPVAAAALNTSLSHAGNLTIHSGNASYSTIEFWSNYVLQQTNGIENMGSFTNWRMVLCFLASWLICYLCISKGIRSTGKVVYVTVSLPYLTMIILFVRGVTLEGAGTGILYYLTPNVTRLASPGVWVDAGSQVLYSLGVCYSVMFSFGSYNQYNTDCYRQSFLFIIVCSGTSFFIGFVVFSFIGHMAVSKGVDVSEVVDSGPGLIFQVLPSGVALFPLSQLWSVLFFVMMTFVGVDTVFGTLEGCFTSLGDIWPAYFGDKASKKYRIGSCFFLMICGLPMMLDGGIYIFELLNYYASSGICLLTVALFQLVSIGWLYGADRFFDDVKDMIGYHPCSGLKYCYKYFSPGLILFIFVFNCSSSAPLTLGKYVFPWWANFIGWMFILSVIVCIPIVIGKTLLRGHGSLRERWHEGLQSKLEEM